MDIFDENNFTISALKFMDDIFARLREKEVNLRHWSIDHLCYRVECLARYEELKKAFSIFSQLLIESDVNGRPIATFKLHRPIQYGERLIDLVELPAPKKGRVEEEGFEHIEIIAQSSFEKIVEENPNCEFDKSGLNKNFNQELKLKLGNLQVKFHYQSLESVINLEKNTKVFLALENSKVLERLKEFNPLVAGTFPLGIFLSSSDLDIIIGHPDLKYIRDTIHKHYGHKDKFADSFSEVKGKKSYLASFEEEGVPIEIFGQSSPSIEQTAYQHFLIEEQILKVGPDKFFSELKELRRSGVKTEPAFTQLLQIPGDPFNELLRLRGKTDYKIYQILKTLQKNYVRPIAQTNNS